LIFHSGQKKQIIRPKIFYRIWAKLFGFKYKGKEFVVSLLPLGGYVAVPQLAYLKEIEGKYEISKNSKEATLLR
jgi:membrane-associated protease RseP (regulator of RpoE activity)